MDCKLVGLVSGDVELVDLPGAGLAYSPGQRVDLPGAEVACSPGQRVGLPGAGLACTPGQSIGLPGAGLACTPGQSIGLPESWAWPGLACSGGPAGLFSLSGHTDLGLSQGWGSGLRGGTKDIKSRSGLW